MMVCVDQQTSEDQFRQDLNSRAPSTTGTGQLAGECHFDDGEDDVKNRAVQTVFQALCDDYTSRVIIPTYVCV